MTSRYMFSSGTFSPIDHPYLRYSRHKATFPKALYDLEKHIIPGLSSANACRNRLRKTTYRVGTFFRFHVRYLLPLGVSH